MHINKFGFPFEKRSSVADFLVLPLLAPIVLFLIDSFLIPQAFLLPLMLVMTLSYLALRLPVPAVASWAIVYLVIVLLVSFYPIETTQTVPYLRPYVRTAFILAGGITACLLASHRTRLLKSNAALVQIISALPSAVVVSDISGNILLMNKACQQLLEGRLHALTGLSFFSTFIGQEEQGQIIAQYVNFFQTDQPGPFPMVLCTRGDRPLKLNVSITIVTLDKTRYAMTLVEKAEDDVPANSI
ncbi:MAG TPA: PAS domain-containing protein [Candidatus Methylacidiphilales bacterium]|nr:PAS domain-containing protein [Candidatus Methylacidiphilales bacterium]